MLSRLRKWQRSESPRPDRGVKTKHLFVRKRGLTGARHTWTDTRLQAHASMMFGPLVTAFLSSCKGFSSEEFHPKPSKNDAFTSITNSNSVCPMTTDTSASRWHVDLQKPKRFDCPLPACCHPIANIQTTTVDLGACFVWRSDIVTVPPGSLRDKERSAGLGARLAGREASQISRSWSPGKC